MKVLLVDDDPTQLKLLRAMLEGEAIETLDAKDGAQALALLTTTTVDAVISDIVMPNLDGYRLCYELRRSERWHRLPFIFYSSTCKSAEDERVARKVGGDGFLHKPQTIKVILKALGDAIAHAPSAHPSSSSAPEDSDLMKQYSGRLVAKLKEQSLELIRRATGLVREARERERAEGKVREHLSLAEKSRGALLSLLEDEQRSSRALVMSNRALTMLGRSNEALIRAVDEASLLNEVCRIAVESRGCRMAWVGYAEDDEARSIRPVASAGDDDGLLSRTALTWKESDPAGGGPAGRSIRTGQPVVWGDVREDPTFYRPEDAVLQGYQSVLCLPLRDGPRTFGLLCLDSVEVGTVSAEELKLLQELADNLAFGIGAIRSKVEQKRAEDSLVASLKEKEALLKEVHHRVKNNMQVITSLLRLEANRINHPTTRSVLKNMQNRIMAMAALHETVYRSNDFSRVDLATYLRQLTGQLSRSLVATPGQVSFQLDLLAVEIGLDQAIPCGLIVNELASNALKHAFPGGRTGQVRIELKQPGPDELQLTVSDDGSGLPADFEAARAKSLGLQLVSDLARQLGGRLRIGPGPQALFKVTFRPSPTSGLN